MGSAGAGAGGAVGPLDPSVPQQREVKTSGWGAGSGTSAGFDATGAGTATEDDPEHDTEHEPEHDTVLPPPVELPPSDSELVQLMREGDDSAYEELFRRHSDAVRRYARTCCRDAHTADDLTAEVFARTLQAVRGGAGPEQAVRAYLMTTVRRVAASWTKTQKREHLVEDFAVFAAEAARASEVSDQNASFGAGLDLGADVLAMHEAEQSLAMQAFRSLPERWQAVLWHTTVEEESPSEVAPLFGLTANATAVLASRAREGLKQAYLQAHVSQSLTAGGDCARYADRLGAYARGGLRMRAERGLRKHLDECAKCRLAAGELAHVNAGIPALLPVAVIGWFAAGYSLKAAGVVAGGAVGAGAAGAAAAATGASPVGRRAVRRAKRSAHRRRWASRPPSPRSRPPAWSGHSPVTRSRSRIRWRSRRWHSLSNRRPRPSRSPRHRPRRIRRPRRRPSSRWPRPSPRRLPRGPPRRSRVPRPSRRPLRHPRRRPLPHPHHRRPRPRSTR